MEKDGLGHQVRNFLAAQKLLAIQEGSILIPHRSSYVSVKDARPAPYGLPNRRNEITLFHREFEQMPHDVSLWKEYVMTDEEKKAIGLATNRRAVKFVADWTDGAGVQQTACISLHALRLLPKGRAAYNRYREMINRLPTLQKLSASGGDEANTLGTSSTAASMPRVLPEPAAGQVRTSTRPKLQPLPQVRVRQELTAKSKPMQPQPPVEQVHDVCDGTVDICDTPVVTPPVTTSVPPKFASSILPFSHKNSESVVFLMHDSSCQSDSSLATFLSPVHSLYLDFRDKGGLFTWHKNSCAIDCALSILYNAVYQCGGMALIRRYLPADIEPQFKTQAHTEVGYLMHKLLDTSPAQLDVSRSALDNIRKVLGTLSVQGLSAEEGMFVNGHDVWMAIIHCASFLLQFVVVTTADAADAAVERYCVPAFDVISFLLHNPKHAVRSHVSGASDAAEGPYECLHWQQAEMADLSPAELLNMATVPSLLLRDITRLQYRKRRRSGDLQPPLTASHATIKCYPPLLYLPLNSCATGKHTPEYQWAQNISLKFLSNDPTYTYSVGVDNVLYRVCGFGLHDGVHYSALLVDHSYCIVYDGMARGQRLGIPISWEKARDSVLRQRLTVTSVVFVKVSDPKVPAMSVPQYALSSSLATRYGRPFSAASGVPAALVQKGAADTITPTAATASTLCPTTDNWKPIGLRNLGNSCYKNAVLQYLLSMPFIRDLLCHFSSCQTITSTTGKAVKKPQQPLLIRGLQKLLNLSTMPRKPLESANLDAVTRAALNDINNDPVWRTSTFASSGEQQDANEWSQRLFQVLFQHLPLSYHFIGCTLVSQLTDQCSSCHNQAWSSKVENVASIELGLSATGATPDVAGLLSAYLQPEHAADYRMACPRCRGVQVDSSTKCFRIAEPREYLQLQLKWTAFSSDALPRIVEMPCFEVNHQLSIPTMTATPTSQCGSAEAVVYELIAVVVHRGSEHVRGHYVAYVRAGSGQQQWYCCDDQAIEQCRVPQGEHLPAAISKFSTGKTQPYQLLYQRVTPKAPVLVSLPLSTAALPDATNLATSSSKPTADDVSTTATAKTDGTMPPEATWQDVRRHQSRRPGLRQQLPTQTTPASMLSTTTAHKSASGPVKRLATAPLQSENKYSPLSSLGAAELQEELPSSGLQGGASTAATPNPDIDPFAFPSDSESIVERRRQQKRLRRFRIRGNSRSKRDQKKKKERKAKSKKAELRHHRHLCNQRLGLQLSTDEEYVNAPFLVKKLGDCPHFLPLCESSVHPDTQNEAIEQLKGMIQQQLAENGGQLKTRARSKSKATIVPVLQRNQPSNSELVDSVAFLQTVADNIKFQFAGESVLNSERGQVKQLWTMVRNVFNWLMDCESSLGGYKEVRIHEVTDCGLLGYWATGLLGYWATGLLGYWATGLLGYWATGLLGYWATGLLVSWALQHPSQLSQGSRPPTTFKSLKEIDRTFSSFGQIFQNRERFRRYFQWLVDVWCVRQSSTIRNYLQHLGTLIKWELNNATNNLALRQELEVVLQEIRGKRCKHSSVANHQRRHKRHMPYLKKQGRAIEPSGFVDISAAAYAVLDAFQQRLQEHVNRQRNGDGEGDDEGDTTDQDELLFTVAEAELYQRALYQAFRNYWGQQRTEILTRPMLGINVTEEPDGGMIFEPGVEKATYLRQEISDLRELAVPRALEPAMRFHLEYTRPVLQAQKKRRPPPPPNALMEDLQRYQQLELQDERAIYLTRKGHRVTPDIVRFCTRPISSSTPGLPSTLRMCVAPCVSSCTPISTRTAPRARVSHCRCPGPTMICGRCSTCWTTTPSPITSTTCPPWRTNSQPVTTHRPASSRPSPHQLRCTATTLVHPTPTPRITMIAPQQARRRKVRRWWN